MQALYQCDALGDWHDDCVNLYFQIFQPETSALTEPNENLEFARALINGTMSHLDFIDTQISAASTHWSLARMCRVDRNILRVAVFEMGFMDDIPPNVTINEAIEIAKKFGTDDSPMFINGVLDNIAHLFSNNPELVKKAVQPKKKRAVA